MNAFGRAVSGVVSGAVAGAVAGGNGSGSKQGGSASNLVVDEKVFYKILVNPLHTEVRDEIMHLLHQANSVTPTAQIYVSELSPKLCGIFLAHYLGAIDEGNEDAVTPSPSAGHRSSRRDDSPPRSNRHARNNSSRRQRDGRGQFDPDGGSPDSHRTGHSRSLVDSDADYRDPLGNLDDVCDGASDDVADEENEDDAQERSIADEENRPPSAAEVTPFKKKARKEGVFDERPDPQGSSKHGGSHGRQSRRTLASTVATERASDLRPLARQSDSKLHPLRLRSQSGGEAHLSAADRRLHQEDVDRALNSVLRPSLEVRLHNLYSEWSQS